jgi:hypothetical protein
MSSAGVAVAAANASLPGAVALGEENGKVLRLSELGMIIIGVLASPVRWWLHNLRVKSARSAEDDLQVSPSLFANPF